MNCELLIVVFGLVVAIVEDAVGFDVVDDGVHGGEGQADVGIRRAVVDGDAAGVSILQGGTGEDHIGHEAADFIGFFRREQVVGAAVEHLAGFIDIQDGAAHGIDKAITGG